MFCEEISLQDISDIKKCIPSNTGILNLVLFDSLLESDFMVIERNGILGKVSALTVALQSDYYVDYLTDTLLFGNEIVICDMSIPKTALFFNQSLIMYNNEIVIQ